MEEITAEYTANELAPSVELRVRPRVTIASKTDLGRVRENNEDKHEFYLPDDPSVIASKGLVFLVCDGMGGHAAGQLASELATKTFIDVYLHHPSAEPETAARAAVAAANRFVFDAARAVPNWRGMGTTLSALLLIQDAALVAHVGDSRVYRLRDGGLSQLTTDHTWVEEAVSSGSMTREEAEAHPYRHVITRAIGTDADVAIDVLRFDLAANDTFLICSDGLMNHVSDDQIASIMGDNGPAESAWKLVAAALAGGGSDNVTVVIARVDALEPA